VLWPVGSGRNVPVQPSMLASNGSSGAQKKVYPARGGDLARLLFPVVVAGNATYNTDAKAQEAWGWLPPTLHGQGRKVQTDWLHRFLLDPHQIRPAAVLRMPKFNMSSQEAQTLANYFAAVDGAAYPYAFDERTTESHLDRLEDERPNRLRDALNIVTEKTTYCVQCHFVGDYSPQGNDPKAFAPQLERVHERLRPDYVHKWIGNPKRILPYTGMPQNFPPTKPADQKLFAGTSHQQLDAVVDLLMSFDRYAKEQFSIKAIVKEAPPPAASGNSASAEQQKSSQ
jgi:cbb3-type cytochrome oxidase cytochrome c subunit